MVSQDHMANLSQYISPTKMAKGTKLGKMVDLIEQFPSSNLFNSLVAWSCKITSQSKTIISTLPQCPWSPNFPGC